MKFLAIGDFHGKCPFSINKVVKDNAVDFILCTGDLCNANRQRVLIFRYWKWLKAGFQLEQIIGRKRNKELMVKAIKSQDSVLKKLGEAKIPVFLVYGNNDYPQRILNQEKLKLMSLEKKLKKYRNIRLLRKGIVHVKDHMIFGISGYQPKLSKKKAGFTDKSIKKQLRKAKGQNLILLTHEPPFGYLDKVRWKASPMHGRHIGNKAVLKIIRSIKPAYHICGHMHENQGRMKTGRTVIVNHGPGYDGNYAIVDVAKKTIKLVH